jgi:hypothetical protein
VRRSWNKSEERIVKSGRVRVKLDDIVEGLELQSDEINAYLHRPSGEVVMLSDDTLQDAEEGIEDDAPDWYKAEIERARAFLQNGDEYIALPDLLDIDEFGMMVGFADSVGNPDTSNHLALALHGRGVFRRFKDLVLHFGIEKEWYAFRDREYVKVAQRWCEDEGIEYDPPVAEE